MSRHTGRSAAKGATVGLLRIGARPSVLGLLLAGLLLAAACDHETSAAQSLRTCVDRWNQGNMVGWGAGASEEAVSPQLGTSESGS